ncbi:hypothetical protein EDC04DRAFT_1199232 [Pisolithus marmoratus]|nr:hypothetical protein EDC04DRAFT_1199232 [Pisolithus marmoratus]
MSTLGRVSYPPICGLPEQWEPREAILDKAMHERLQLVIKQDITDEEMKMLDSWRLEVRELPLLPIQTSPRNPFSTEPTMFPFSLCTSISIPSP